MNLSVVILTCNQKELTLRCLSSLEELMRDKEVEVIVIDNGSTDATGDEITERYGEKVIYKRLNRNEGVARGRNEGAKLAKGERIFFLDNDTIVSEKAIKGLWDYLDQHPQCGLVAPKLVSPSGQIQDSFKPFPGLMIKARNWLSKKEISEVKTPILHEPFYVIGAAQMFDKALFEKLGGLDSKIFFGPEDADFCMRIREMGKKVVYNPEFTIIHDYQRSTSGRKFTRRAFRHIKALLYFYKKHRRIF